MLELWMQHVRTAVVKVTYDPFASNVECLLSWPFCLLNDGSPSCRCRCRCKSLMWLMSTVIQKYRHDFCPATATSTQPITARTSHSPLWFFFGAFWLLLLTLFLFLFIYLFIFFWPTKYKFNYHNTSQEVDWAGNWLLCTWDIIVPLLQRNFTLCVVV